MFPLAKTGGREGGFGGSNQAEEASQWRRSGPLPALEAPANRRTNSRYGDEGRSPTTPDVDRDWGAARGSRFTAAEPSSAPPMRGSGPSFRDAPREPPRDMADIPNEWRSNRPTRVEAPPAPEREFRRGGQEGGARSGGFIEREVGLGGAAGTEETVSRARQTSSTDDGAIAVELKLFSGTSLFSGLEVPNSKLQSPLLLLEATSPLLPKLKSKRREIGDHPGNLLLAQKLLL